eukprot:8289541-Pyramimonas_sp.AAC.1
MRLWSALYCKTIPKLELRLWPCTYKEPLCLHPGFGILLWEFNAHVPDGICADVHTNSINEINIQKNT